MATSSDIAQSDLAELLRVLDMGDHARPQSPHEVFQEALGVLEMKLWSQEGRIIRLAASVSALVNMLRSRPDIHALCGIEERDILAEACTALNAEEFYASLAADKTTDSDGPRFKLVPVGPTIRMQEVGLAALEVAIRIHGKPTLPGFAATHVWRAMLKEAPSRPLTTAQQEA